LQLYSWTEKARVTFHLQIKMKPTLLEKRMKNANKKYRKHNNTCKAQLIILSMTSTQDSSPFLRLFSARRFEKQSLTMSC